MGVIKKNVCIYHFDINVKTTLHLDTTIPQMVVEFTCSSLEDKDLNP